MHLLQLNNDVVDSILSVTEQPSLLNFGRTCRSAYDAVIPYLLASIIFPRTKRLQLAFCQYMLADAEHRIPAMRTFRYPGYTARKLRDNDIDESALWSMLAQILMQAQNIRTLTLFNPDMLLEHDPRIVDAIVQYPLLTTLEISSFKTLSHNMLLSLRHLRNLTISNDSDVFPFIVPFQSTLEVLVIGKVSGWRWPSRVLSDCSVHRFLNVRRLELCGGYEIPTQIMTRLFPNLSELRLHSRCDCLLPTTLASNRSNSECWPKLDFLRGEVLKLHDLVLSSRVRYLHVDGRPGYQELGTFIEVVRVLTPLALKFCVHVGETSEAFYKELAKHSSHLKFLNLTGGFLDEQLVSALVIICEVANELTIVICVPL
jgi:hypothetical protein